MIVRPPAGTHRTRPPPFKPVHPVTDTPIHLRRARPEDARSILDLEAHFLTDRIPLRSIRRFLRVPSARVWVAERGAEIVGSLVCLTRRGTTRARIYSVVVAPTQRGQRIGERLIGAAEHDIRAAGLQAMSLEVAVENTPARALYAKLGYQPIEALDEYYEDGGDGVRMLKRL